MAQNQIERKCHVERHRPSRRCHCALPVARAKRATGFILTAGLGIVGAFVATFIGQVRCKNLGWRSRGTFWAGSSAASRPVRQPVEGPVAAWPT
jgi:hypothetical protein